MKCKSTQNAAISPCQFVVITSTADNLEQTLYIPTRSNFKTKSAIKEKESTWKDVEGTGLQMIILTITCEEPPILFYAQQKPGSLCIISL